MGHYTPSDWVDFANDRVSAIRRVEMQGHVDTGCNKCRQELQIWQAVRKVAARESQYQPPDNVVRAVKAAFAAVPPRSRRGVAARITELAELVVDSLAQPTLAGVRSAGTGARHMLFRAGSLRIDLRLEPLPNSDQMSLDGQVLDSSEGAKMFSELPVTLLAKRGPLAQTKTNKFGEFHLECAKAGGLSVALAVSGQKQVVVPLGKEQKRRSRKSSGRG
ncbi:MAG TPA: hypothetical protein VOA64_18185 [Candidatus Dormibacteraeota bacterium]|nr:hypothetical protein [Candidatus Dormibacteraeota bacterium]